MHHLLEDYLSQVESELREVPNGQREEDLREMRQHLTNAVTVNQEILGQDEDQAVENALTEFGSPSDLAAEMLAAWRRGEAKEDRRSLIGAALCSMLVLKLGLLLFDVVFRSVTTQRLTLAQTLPPAQPAHGSEHALFVNVSFEPWCLLIWALIGGLTGLLFPRRALAGTLTTLAAGYLITICLITAGHPTGVVPALLMSSVYVMAEAVWTLGWARLAIRWRRNRMPNFQSRLFQ